MCDAFAMRRERACSRYLTLNTVPFEERPEVVAPPPAGSLSRMRVTVHPPFEIPCARPPFAVAKALATGTAPKFASRTVEQLFWASQDDGASTIQSAEVTSGDDICLVALKAVFRLRFLMWSFTV